MKKIENIVGKKFNMLTILSQEPTDSKKYGKYSGNRVMAKCDCGVIRSLCQRSVLRGRTKSCGCLCKSITTKHGLSGKRLYAVWKGMVQRCHDPKHYGYKSYGGRGITVCEEWKDSVSTFYAWSMDNGYLRGLTIDRIDNNGNYCPENCRFVTRTENLNNTSKTIFLCIDGEKIPLQFASKKYGINNETLYQRITKLSWDHKKAVLTPVRKISKRG